MHAQTNARRALLATASRPASFPVRFGAAILLALLVLEPVTVRGPSGPAAAGKTPSPSAVAAEAASAVEKLFRAARYDSLLHVIDDYERTAVETGDSLLLGRMIVQRGRVQLMTGRFVESLHTIDAGIRVAQAVRDTSGWMPALTFKGYALAGIAGYDEAMECYRKRLSLARQVGSPLDEAWALTNIAYVLHLRGDQEGARDDYGRAIFLFRRGGRRDLEVTPLIGLGRVRSALGDTPGAVRCYQRAWVVARDIGDRENEMWAANNLGALESVGGDMNRAIQYAQRAYDIARDMGYPRGAILPAINIASWRMELGEFARAQAILDDAAAFCVRSGDEEFRAKIDFHKARLALHRGQYHAAAAEFRRLLAEGRLEPQNADFAWVELASALAHSDSAAAAVDILSMRLASGVRWYADSGAVARLLLSRLLLQNDHPGGALQQAVRCREEAERNGWRQTAVSARLREAACYHALGRGSEALTSLGAGLDSLESARVGQSEPEWRELFGQHTSTDVLDACRAVLDYPTSVPPAQRKRAFYNTLQRFKTRTLLERITAPRNKENALAPVTGGNVTIEQLQAGLLSSDELLLDIFVGDAESVLFAVTADSLRVLSLAGERDPLRDKAAMYRGVLSDPSPASQALYTEAQIRAMQAALGREVLGGVADLLPRYRRVLICPDGFYSLIPFGTLAVPGVRSESRAAGTDGGLLLETHDVGELHSASALALVREAAPAVRGGPARVLVVVPPDGARLPGAIDEARAITRRYQGAEVVHGLEGSSRDLAALAVRFDVLHIAAHAQVNDESPWNSGFDLSADEGRSSRQTQSMRGTSTERSGTGTPGAWVLTAEDSIVVASTFSQDRWLRAWRIARAWLPFEMAVLAGCETAGGRATTGEGVLGLTAAFSSAGVPVVVSSLWPIDDRATDRLMEGFYTRLAAGATVAEALRFAQLDIRGSESKLHPFYWAGFTVVGDGNVLVSLRPAHRFPLWLTAWVAALVVVALAATARKRATSRRASKTSPA